MRTINEQASRTSTPIVGEAVTTRRSFYVRSKAILVTPHLNMSCPGCAGCITSGERGTFLHPDTLWHADDLDQVREGNIARPNSSSTAIVLWEEDPLQNSLMLAGTYNCSCLMCPQPPQEHAPELLQQTKNILDLLHDKHVPHIYITGGEPTLLKDNFIRLLYRCMRERPESVINILTNGKASSDMTFARDAAHAASTNTLLCVSLRSEIDQIHDRLVGKEGNFDRTRLGICSLAQYGAYIEVRRVITKLNYKRLLYFAEHVYSYFPFCPHYALMGLELCGYAAANKERIAVSPHGYKEELALAVLYMHHRGLPVSVYNIPLCLCTPRVRPFARQFISAWENRYVQQCSECTRQEGCTEFFSTSVSLPFEYIQPIREEV